MIAALLVDEPLDKLVAKYNPVRDAQKKIKVLRHRASGLVYWTVD